MRSYFIHRGWKIISEPVLTSSIIILNTATQGKDNTFKHYKIPLLHFETDSNHSEFEKFEEMEGEVVLFSVYVRISAIQH
jgi:hypothetical protein